MERACAILRDDTQLWALTIEQNGTFTAPVLRKSDNTISPMPEYKIVKRPLEKASESLFPRKKRLLASWAKLSHCNLSNPHTLFHVLVILLETRPLSSGRRIKALRSRMLYSLQPLGMLRDPERPVRSHTAASLAELLTGDCTHISGYAHEHKVP